MKIGFTTHLEIEDEDVLDILHQLEPMDVLKRLRGEDIMRYCRWRYTPADVFDEEDLADWARAHMLQTQLPKPSSATAGI